MYYSLLNASLTAEVIGKDEIESVLIELISGDALFLDFRLSDQSEGEKASGEHTPDEEVDSLKPEEFFEEVKKRNLYRVSEWFYRRENVYDKVCEISLLL